MKKGQISNVMLIILAVVIMVAVVFTLVLPSLSQTKDFFRTLGQDDDDITLPNIGDCGPTFTQYVDGMNKAVDDKKYTNFLEQYLGYKKCKGYRPLPDTLVKKIMPYVWDENKFEFLVSFIFEAERLNPTLKNDLIVNKYKFLSSYKYCTAEDKNIKTDYCLAYRVPLDSGKFLTGYKEFNSLLIDEQKFWYIDTYFKSQEFRNNYGDPLNSEFPFVRINVKEDLFWMGLYYDAAKYYAKYITPNSDKYSDALYYNIILNNNLFIQPDGQRIYVDNFSGKGLNYYIFDKTRQTKTKSLVNNYRTTEPLLKDLCYSYLTKYSSDDKDKTKEILFICVGLVDFDLDKFLEILNKVDLTDETYNYPVLLGYYRSVNTVDSSQLSDFSKSFDNYVSKSKISTEDLPLVYYTYNQLIRSHNILNQYDYSSTYSQKLVDYGQKDSRIYSYYDKKMYDFKPESKYNYSYISYFDKDFELHNTKLVYSRILFNQKKYSEALVYAIQYSDYLEENKNMNLYAISKDAVQHLIQEINFELNKQQVASNSGLFY